MPAAGDGISTVVLSVWISTSGSSSAISSPSATSQRATSPSVRPSPRSGSLNSYGIARPIAGAMLRPAALRTQGPGGIRRRGTAASRADNGCAGRGRRAPPLPRARGRREGPGCDRPSPRHRRCRGGTGPAPPRATRPSASARHPSRAPRRHVGSPRASSTDTGRRSRSRAAPAPCRSKIAFSAMIAASSAPKPTVRGASWTITTRPVFATDARIVSSSSGRSERMSTTSHDASPASSSAARSHTGTIAP